MPVTGQKLVARNIVAFGGGFLKHTNKTMRSVRKILDDKVAENMSGPFTPAYFKILDHPYAKKHGLKGKPISDPYWIVNKQTGTLKKAKESGTVKASFKGTSLTASAFVRINTEKAEYAEDVVFGTSKMIPRPFLEGSRDQVLDKAIKIIEKRLRNFTAGFN